MKIIYELTFKQFYDLRQALNAVYFRANIPDEIQWINVKEFLFISGRAIIDLTYKQKSNSKKMKFKIDLNHYQALQTMLIDNKNLIEPYLFSLFMGIQIGAEKQIQATIVHFKSQEIR